MNNLIAVTVIQFKAIARFYGEEGQWCADNIKNIMEYFYNIPVGNEVQVTEYIKEIYGEEKVSIFMRRLMPFLTGAYGILDLSFETANGEKVTANNWNLANEIGKENIQCRKDDGTEVSMDEVFLIFRRNNQMNLNDGRLI